MRCSLAPPACRALLGGLVALVLSAPAVGREWHMVNDLFIFKADLVAYDGKEVTFNVPGARSFTFPIEKMSEADRAYLKSTYPNGLKDPKAKDDKKDSDKKPDAKPAADSPLSITPPAAKPPVAKPAAGAKPVVPKVARAARPAAKARPRGAEPAKAGGVSVQVVSMTITRPPEGGLEGSLMNPGTHFTLLVSDPSRTIAGLDSEKSKITRCIDDKRTDLTRSADGGAESGGLGMLMLEVLPGGNSGTIELDLPQLPDPKATRMLIRGELHVICGDGANTETVMVPLNIILGVGL